jgi:hypothetical protein
MMMMIRELRRLGGLQKYAMNKLAQYREVAERVRRDDSGSMTSPQLCTLSIGFGEGQTPGPRSLYGFNLIQLYAYEYRKRVPFGDLYLGCRRGNGRRHSVQGMRRRSRRRGLSA